MSDDSRKPGNNDSELAQTTCELADGSVITCDILSDGSARLVECTLSQPSLELPSAIEGHVIREIADKVFSYSKLEHIVLPNGIERIGAYAFAVSNLSEIDLPDSVCEIGARAFFRCAKLQRAHLGSGLVSIGDWAFSETALEAIRIPKSVRSMGIRSFFGTKIAFAEPDATLTLEDGNTYLFVDGKGCLYYRLDNGYLLSELLDVSIESYSVLEGTIEISPEAFLRATNLASVSFPKSLLKIGNSAFKNCKKLTQARFPEKLEYVGDGAFEHTALAHAYIPETLVHIGESALATLSGNASDSAPTLLNVEVEPANQTYFTRDGILYARIGDGKTEAVVYYGTGPDVVFDCNVERVGSYALNGVETVRSLEIHDTTRIIGFHGLAAKGTLERVTLILSQPIEGRMSVSFDFPCDITSQRTLQLLLKKGAFTAKELVYCYDLSVSQQNDTYDQSKRILNRLLDPYLMDSYFANLFKRFINNMLDEVFYLFASHNYIEGFDKLVASGHLNKSNIAHALEIAAEERCVAATSKLLQIQHESFQESSNDFSL